jgi:hypothetical protein
VTRPTAGAVSRQLALERASPTIWAFVVSEQQGLRWLIDSSPESIAATSAAE